MNRDILDDIGRAVSGAAETVSRKAGEVVEITRLKNQIYSLEREIRKDYAAIGKLVYESYAESGETDGAFLEFCEEIAQKEILIDQYEGEIEERKKAGL